jgi:uncharacterized protein (TIGR03437 family)
MSRAATRLLCLLVVAGIAPAQISVTRQRVAGLPPDQWPIGDGGPATDAFLTPTALAWDQAGNLLVADNRSNRIRRISADGSISTVVIGSSFGIGAVNSMAVDTIGHLYVSDSHVGDYGLGKPRLLQISPAGRVTEIPVPNPATYLAPDIAIDVLDNLYITDVEGGYVWKRSPSGTAQKIAGKGGLALPDDSGPALEVTLSGPHALSFDKAGNLLIADWAGTLRLNHDGTLTRLTGGRGIVPGIHVGRIAGATDGSIYMTGDWYGIWRLDPGGQLAPFAGTDQDTFSDGCSANGKRTAKYATLQAYNMLVDGAGRVYFSDPRYMRVRRIEWDGSIRTVAGSGLRPRESAEAQALQAIVYLPGQTVVDRLGNLFFVEPSANRVRQITTDGRIRTVVGTDSAPPGEDVACYSPPPGADVLSAPNSIAVDPSGNLFVSDTGNRWILRRSPDGRISPVAEPPRVSRPSSLAADSQGNVYFFDDANLRRLRTDGNIDSLSSPAPGAGALAVGPDDLLVLSHYNGLFKQAASGALYPLRRSGGYGGVAVDTSGAIYTSDVGGIQRTSASCNTALITGAWGPSVSIDALSNLYTAESLAIWRSPLGSFTDAQKPAPYLANPGVFNSASNLAAFVTTPSRNPFHPPTSTPVNDSIAPDEIVRLRGGCLGPLETAEGKLAQGRLPTSIAGTRVLFDGVPAPLVSIQSAEILAIVPHKAVSQGKIGVMVENQGVKTSATVDASLAAPGIYVVNGIQADAFNHEDSTLNGPAHPAAVGSLVSIFLTGAGVTTPLLEDGVPAAVPLPPLALPVAVRVLGVPAEIVYAGATEGLAGIGQVTFRVPQVDPADAVPVQITVGGISRGQYATIAVR